VLQFIGAGENGGRWYLVTELCRYRSLQELLASATMRATLTWSVRKRMLREAATGLAHLHTLKIVHMDIKPLNFFVTEHLAIKVGDFGLAKQLEHTQMNASVKG
jgi:serine/threonine protein kinase